MIKNYDDIINLERPVSKNHMPMDKMNRAAQFAPFAALTGFEAAIDKTRRNNDERIEFHEIEREIIDDI